MEAGILQSMDGLAVGADTSTFFFPCSDTSTVGSLGIARHHWLSCSKSWVFQAYRRIAVKSKGISSIGSASLEDPGAQGIHLQQSNLPREHTAFLSQNPHTPSSDS